MTNAGDERAEENAPEALILFGLIAALMGGDVVADSLAGTTPLHLLAELSVTGLALAGVGLLWRRIETARRTATTLGSDLAQARAEAARWRAETREMLQGLAVAIDRQFDRWELTAAERDIGLLLLKGLSHKEIAGIRRTTERTARQQALALYRKSGLSGRSELAAFFLEDLLLPGALPDREPA